MTLIIGLTDEAASRAVELFKLHTLPYGEGGSRRQHQVRAGARDGIASARGFIQLEPEERDFTLVT